MSGFKWAVRLKMLANLSLAITMLLSPKILVDLFSLPGGTAAYPWLQAIGIFYVFITFGYLPSAFAPSKTLAANLFPLLGAVVPICLLLWQGGGFFWLAIYELFFLVILNVAHRRGYIAALMALP